MLKMSAFQIFHGGNSNLMNKTKFSFFTLPLTQHHSFFRIRDYLVSRSLTEMYSHTGNCIKILLFLFHFVPFIHHFLLHILLFIRNPQYKEIIYAIHLSMFPIEKTRRPVRRHFTAHFDRDNVATRQVSLQNLYSRLVEMAEVT